MKGLLCVRPSKNRSRGKRGLQPGKCLFSRRGPGTEIGTFLEGPERRREKNMCLKKLWLQLHIRTTNNLEETSAAEVTDQPEVLDVTCGSEEMVQEQPSTIPASEHHKKRLHS
ncbi:hypothetical protein GDO81_005822 [Engystomops pustulosus]|uniref:Uncharacterized protein n=1 Tax=Engystomops pustulosus TaxID=76066 RepID=A0AAV7CTM3_ENGPU|nr:hypothetical protein GDO81_005822 [Engystomops pustulosus]